MEIKDSTTHTVQNASIQVRTGRKWKAWVEADQATSRPQHKEIIGRVQKGRMRLGFGEAPWFWFKASRRERKDLVVSEVTSMENVRYKIKADAQGHQGSWTM